MRIMLMCKHFFSNKTLLILNDALPIELQIHHPIGFEPITFTFPISKIIAVNVFIGELNLYLLFYVHFGGLYENRTHVSCVTSMCSNH